MKTLRWSVCGAGGLAGRKVVRDGLFAAANCELVAVQSYPPESALVESERYSVPGFASVDEMLDSVNCDAVYIATPQFLHLDQVKAAASRGKHVLCEKPLATNVIDAQEIVRTCRDAKVMLGTDFNYRYHPLHQKMRDLLKQGAIGDFVSARCQFGQNYPPTAGAFRQKMETSGGGVFADMGNHAVDLLEYIMGRDVRRITAASRNLIYHYETEDAAMVMLEFAQGGLAVVDCYFCSPIDTLRNDIEINGTLGTIYTQGTLQMDTLGKLVLRRSGETTMYDCPKTDMYSVVFEKFAGAVLDGGELPATGEEGLHSQRVIETVYRSSEKGCTLDMEGL